MFIVLAVAIIATIIILTVQLVQFVLDHQRREQLRDLYTKSNNKYVNVYTKSDNTKHRNTKKGKKVSKK
jgi:hypothetical protein